MFALLKGVNHEGRLALTSRCGLYRRGHVEGHMLHRRMMTRELSPEVDDVTYCSRRLIHTS